MRNETLKRGQKYEGVVTDSEEDDMSDDDSVAKLARVKTPE